MKREIDVFKPRFLAGPPGWGDFQREMNRVFDDFVGEWERPTLRDYEFAPACDISEKKDHFLLTVDLPGVRKEDIKLEVVDNVLTISGEKREEREESEEGRYMKERFQGKFSRSFTLPSDVKSEKVEAAFENGELKVVIPKSEEKKATEVPIGESRTGLLDRVLGRKGKESIGAAKAG